MSRSSGSWSEPTPCLRHSRVWLASCAECTAWHLPRQIAARTAAEPTAVVLRPRFDRPALRLAA